VPLLRLNAAGHSLALQHRRFDSPQLVSERFTASGWFDLGLV
jgi:hypothetical protein